MSSPFDQPASAAASAARQFGHDQEDDGLDGEYSMMEDYPDELDYFALLGLPSNPPASDAEIRSAYRNLTLSFHPDKQPAHLREAAQLHFTRIQEAYDTLTDPKKRAVYDLLGADGVRREWGTGGAMGHGGEAQKQQVGVKAMSPDRFRRWFLKTMKSRERKAVESLVGSQGVLTIGIDASDAISVDEHDDVTFHVPSPRLANLGATYKFNAPLPLPRTLYQTDDEDTEEKEEETTTSKKLGGGDEDPVQITINSGIMGNVVRPKKKAQVSHPDGSVEDIEIRLAPMLVAPNLTLGATVTPNLNYIAGNKGLWNRQPLSFLKGSTVVMHALLLPTPSFKTTVARSIQPIPGIKPFQVTASSTVQRSLSASPPSFEVHITREVAPRKLAFMAWSSGDLFWPQTLFERFSSLGMDLETSYATTAELSSLQVGLVALPTTEAGHNNAESYDDDDDDDADHTLLLNKAADRTAESWQAFVTVNPGGGGLGLNYSRNLFSGKPADDPIRTEWSAEGYYPMTKMEEARAVRLEVNTLLGADMSISWSVKGTRRVGEYTTIGVGFGLAQNGTIMTVSWKRLGQAIDLPIVICPASEANHDATVLATIFPWLAYCAVEFGYIRPRNRKKRRQAAAQRHKELQKLVPRKRLESEQAIEMMYNQVQRRQAREDAQNGLVITKAEYGYIPPKNKKPKRGFTEPRVIDVTVPVAAMVDRSQLVLPGNTLKFKMIGFHDPAPLLPKRLKIWYTFNGQDHFVEVGDKEGVTCPMRSHLT